MNRTGQLLAAWCGPIFPIIVVIGLVGLAGFIPPPSPTDSGEEIAAMFRDNVTGIRVGMWLFLFASMLMAAWGIGVATQTRRAESGHPVLSYVQIACITVGAYDGVLAAVVWGVAAFRPDVYSPETMLVLNDIGWFLFVWAASMFPVWQVAMGAAILLDKSDSPAFPRWAGYWTLWTAFSVIPTTLVIFFKTGPFAWDGLFGLYLPTVTFFSWFIAIVVLHFKAINRQSREYAEAHPESEIKPLVAPKDAPVTVS